MRKIFLLILLVPILFVSCSGNEFSVKGVVAQPFMEATSHAMGLSVYVRTDKTEDQTVSFEITNPDKSLTWTVNAKKLLFDNATYYGSSDIYMPDTRILDIGEWTLTVMSNDGSTEDFKLNISYSYGFPEQGKTGTYYDSEKNLTFVF